jgi:hypothetical protein
VRRTMTITSASPSASDSAPIACHQISTKPHDPFDSVASLLGWLTSEPRQRVSGATALLDIAADKGVSSTDLMQALEDGAPEACSSPDLETSCSRSPPPPTPMFVRGPGDGHHGPEPRTDAGSEGSDRAVLDTDSSLLKTDSDTLAQHLTSGTSLADLLEQHGITLEELSSALQQRLGSSATRGLRVGNNAWSAA